MADASGSDFVASGDEGAKTLAFSSGETSKTYTVATVSDTVDEPAGDVKLTVGTGTGYTVGTPSSATVTINDDDDAPSGAITLALSPTSADESDDATTVTVTATMPGSTTRGEDTNITVKVGDTGDEATEGTDYATIADFTLTIASGATTGTKTFSIDPTQDTVDEGTGEKVSVKGSTSVARLFVTGADFTINDDDDAPSGAITLALSPTSADESDDATTVTVTATMPGSTTRGEDTNITVKVGDTGDEATEGTDYATIADFTLTIASGATTGTKTFSIDPTQDTVDEGTGEKVSVKGSTSVARLFVTGADFTINDDDDAGFVFSALMVIVSEAPDEKNSATYTVALASQPSTAVTVAIESRNEDTAMISPTTINFSTTNWMTGQTITVTGIDDDIFNTPERTSEIIHTSKGGDYDGMSDMVMVMVEDNEAPVALVIEESLAAMARAHLASARTTLGRRVEPDITNERSRLTVRGRTIPLDKTGMRKAAEQLLGGWAVAALRGGGLAEGVRAFERRMTEYGAAATDRQNGATTEPHDPLELAVLGLRHPSGFGTGSGGTEFVFGWGSKSTGSRPGWQFWGQGDLQTFAGDPSPVRGYEGNLRTGYVGLDHTLGKHWLVGMAVARSRGVGDWHTDLFGGRLKTSLTTLHPYLRWSDEATSLWAMAGGGRGSTENAWATGRVGASTLDLRLGLVEARRRFTGWFGLRADAGWARLATGAGEEIIDDRSGAVNQQRLGIELSPSARLGIFAIKAFAEASARRDGGAGQTGSGLEVSGGFGVAKGPVHIDARGRMLVLHSAQGYQERGLGVTLTVGSSAAEEGLSLSISPRWGGPATGSGELWNERIGILHPPGTAADGPWLLDSRVRWAVRLPSGRLLAWSGEFTRSAQGYALTIGGGLKLAGRGHASTAKPHQVR